MNAVVRTHSRANENLRRNVAGLLKARRIPLLRFCNEFGLDRRAIYYLLSGEGGATVDRAEKIAEGLGVTLGELLDGVLPEADAALAGQEVDAQISE